MRILEFCQIFLECEKHGKVWKCFIRIWKIQFVCVESLYVKCILLRGF